MKSIDRDRESRGAETARERKTAVVVQRAAGDRVIAWDDEAAQVAAAAGVEAETLLAAIGAEAAEAIEDAAIAWTKDFGTAPLQDGRQRHRVGGHEVPRQQVQRAALRGGVPGEIDP